MTAKNIVSIVLLLFVAASVVYLVASESSSQTGPDEGSAIITPAQPAAAKPDVELPKVSEEAQQPEYKLIAYYFHGDFRCRTCLAMEAYAREALEEGLSEKLESGRLEWRAVNFDKPENEHFTQDFELTSSALVLVNMVDNKQKEWKNLPQIWDLVGDEWGFKDYVRSEALVYLENGS